jgi:hypothetical protein
MFGSKFSQHEILQPSLSLQTTFITRRSLLQAHVTRSGVGLPFNRRSLPNALYPTFVEARTLRQGFVLPNHVHYPTLLTLGSCHSLRSRSPFNRRSLLNALYPTFVEARTLRQGFVLPNHAHYPFRSFSSLWAKSWHYHPTRHSLLHCRYSTRLSFPRQSFSSLWAKSWSWYSCAPPFATPDAPYRYLRA